MSKALFALTCRRIFNGLDTEYVEYLRDPANSRRRQDFLEILEEDLPEYISCWPVLWASMCRLSCQLHTA
jgi:hypothetical protein